MKHKNIKLLVCAICGLILTGCDFKNPQGYSQSNDTLGISEQQLTEQPTEQKQSAEQKQTAEQKKSINTDWQYFEQEDKLNDLKNYEARILSTNGKVECTVSAIDLTGSGNYVNVLGVAWFDETIPACYDKIYIGMKFPGDSKWRKIIIKCKGHSGALIEDLKLMEELGLFKSKSQFSILIANEEFTFKPSRPLKWNH